MIICMQIRTFHTDIHTHIKGRLRLDRIMGVLIFVLFLLFVGVPIFLVGALVF